MTTQRINKTFFPNQRVPEGPQIVTPSRNPFHSDLLETIFGVCKDPNMMEEEYLAGITGMGVNQIHSWCKQDSESASQSITTEANWLSFI